MKTILCYLAILVGINVQAATWTIHGFKDNFMQVNWVTSQPAVIGQPFYFAWWDWNWDVQNPGMEDSGVYGGIEGSGNTNVFFGYQDAATLDVPFNAICLLWELNGGAPDYNGYVPIEEVGPPGEYWIDFASDGTARISTIIPLDFGKWAWDGSINPNYVALLTKKHHGKK